MPRKEEGADEDIEIPRGNRKFLSARHTQKIKAAGSLSNAAPNQRAHALAEKEAEDRHEHDVERRDKACFAGCCKLNAGLLKIRSDREECAAAQTTEQQFFAIVLLLLSTALHRFEFPKQYAGQKQLRTGNEAAHGVERIAAQKLCALTLGDECRTPDNCRSQRQNDFSDISFLHGLVRPFKK